MQIVLPEFYSKMQVKPLLEKFFDFKIDKVFVIEFVIMFILFILFFILFMSFYLLKLLPFKIPISFSNFVKYLCENESRQNVK